jgi:Xaa-Pro aminopeptidase
MKAAFWEKVGRIREILRQQESAGFLIRRCDNFAWLTFGARSYITLNSVEGVAGILITEDCVEVHTDNIEMRRIQEVEIPPELWECFCWKERNWWEGDLWRTFKKNGAHILSDTEQPETEKSSCLDGLRMKLCDIEMDEYRDLGRICDQTLTDVVRSIHPEWKETEAQGLIAKALIERGLDPILVLVFGEESALRYRHNLPRNSEMGRNFFFSICARKKGLVVSATRSARFGMDDDIKDQHNQNAWIDAVAIAHSRPGIRLNEVFGRIQKAYEKAGYPGEWNRHHQGGIAGYNAREQIASPSSDGILQSGYAVAWNPTITGTKSEDTVLIRDERNEIVSFPQDSQWPCLSFELNGMVVRRPDMMILRR